MCEGKNVSLRGAKQAIFISGTFFTPQIIIFVLNFHNYNRPPQLGAKGSTKIMNYFTKRPKVYRLQIMTIKLGHTFFNCNFAGEQLMQKTSKN